MKTVNMIFSHTFLILPMIFFLGKDSSFFEFKRVITKESPIELVRKYTLETNGNDSPFDNSNTSAIQNGKSYTFGWADLNIQPQRSPEGAIYTFTAFDCTEDVSSLIYVGSSADHYWLRYFDIAKREIYYELELNSLPLDVRVINEKVYVLTASNLVCISDKTVTKDINHEIKNVFLFDKLLVIDEQPVVLMSDGSSFIFDGNKMNPIEKLSLKGEQVYIKKTSNHGFSLISSNSNNTIHSSKSNENDQLGSITILGADDENIICIKEEFVDNKPIQVNRFIVSSGDNFKSNITQLPKRNFSHIKNDCKLNNSILRHLAITNQGITLTIKSI